jgi:hypothetical protein
MNKYHSLVGALVIILIAAIGILISVIFNQSSQIPSSVQKQISFIIFYPDISTAVVQKNTVKYDKSNKFLNFIVKYNQYYLTFSEQTTPSEFNYDSNIYPEFVQKLNSYDSFGSVDGTVYLTHPNSANYETAIMNAKGTLLFAKTDNGLMDVTKWQTLFNTMQYQTP